MKNLEQELEAWVLENTEELIDDIFEGVKEKTPVRTGTLKASWEKRAPTKLGDNGQVGNTQDYATYVEDGTTSMAPRNMLKATLDKVERK
jgi:hypothetical protein